MTRAFLRTLPLVLLALAACRSTPDYNAALPEGAPALIPVGANEKLPDFGREWDARDELLPSLDNSLAWMRRPHAKGTYPQAGIDYDRALASLERFRALLAESESREAFAGALAAEFQVYKSAGWDGRGGGVLFTAYCTPILPGSVTRDSVHRFPLYALPPDLVKNKDGSVRGWETNFGLLEAYPSRGAIEAGNILANKGLELVYLTDPIDAYIAHVNGSAFIELPDGQMLRLGYAGKNGQPYHSLGRELEEDGKIPRGQASLRAIREWAAQASPDEIAEYLDRNPSYVFFTPIQGNPHGSLDVEVTGGRSLATDKTLFPRGALVYVDASEAPAASKGKSKSKSKAKPKSDTGQADASVTVADTFGQFLFDQDTGGAIRTAGRADIYLGIGPEAEERAGRVKVVGQLYYLFLKE